jgi:hypothetical protein
VPKLWGGAASPASRRQCSFASGRAASPDSALRGDREQREDQQQRLWAALNVPRASIHGTQFRREVLYAYRETFCADRGTTLDLGMDNPVDGALHIYTDGSCYSSPRVGGTGFLFIVLDENGEPEIYEESPPGWKGATNNQMEPRRASRR